jgi:uncharacterized protein YjdB
MRRFRVFALGMAALVAGTVSCENSPNGPPDINAIVVNLGLNTLVVGQTVQADAIAREIGGAALTGITLTWSSSNTSVATVSPGGLVTAVAPGTTQISATAGGVTGTANITVVPPPPVPVVSVLVTLAANSVIVGQATTATGTPRDAAGAALANRTIEWSSSNTSVARVTQTGAVTTFAAGTAQIIATVEGVSGNATLTVQPPVGSVTVALAASSISVGQTTTATATVRDAGNVVLTGRPVTWTSSTPAVATVNATTGVVTAVGPGLASIVATSEGIAGGATLTVVVPVASVSVALTSPISVGQSTTAVATLRDAANNVLTDRTVTWSSSNTAIATVNATTGVVTGVAVGSATITALAGGVSGTANVTVQVSVASVSVSLSAASIVVGQTTTATATVRDAGGNIVNRTVSWTSSNAAVATVTPGGLVSGVGIGTTNIIGAVDGVLGVAQLAVASPAGPPAQLAIVSQPAGAVSGIQFAPALSVQIQDAVGRLTNSTAAVTVAITTGTGALVGTATVNAVNGVAVFNTLRIDGAGQHVLTVSSTGLPSVPSNAITVTQNPVALSIQVQPAGAATGSPLVTQPVIRILDNAGLLITNSTLAVTATKSSGNGTLTGVTTVNAVGGVATFTNLRIDGGGAHTLTFSTTAPALQVVSNAFPVASGPAAQIVMATQPSGAVSGLALTGQPAVQLQDVAGNLTTSGAAVTAAITAGNGVLVGQATVNAVNGVAQFTNLRIDGSGAQTLTFTSAGLTATSSSSFNVTQNAASLAIQTQPAGATTGSAMTTQPVIRILDNAGLVVVNSALAVTATRTTGTGTLSGTTTLNAVNGVATFTNLRIDGSGNHVLTFSTAAPALQIASNAFNVAVGPPAQLAITTQPAGASSGVDFTTQPVVEIRDAANSLVASSTVAVTAAIGTGSGTLTGTVTVNAVNGVATFGSLRINGVGAHTLTFTSTGLTSVTSAVVNVTQTPASLAIQTQPGGATTGSAMATQPSIRILDNSGQLIANSTLGVTAAITTGGGTLTGTTTVNAVNGVATFTNLRIDGSGNHVLTFSTTAPALQIASNGFNVAVGPANRLGITTQPNNAQDGSAFVTQPVVEVQDVAGQRVTTSSAPVTAAVTTGAGALSGTLTVNAVNGVATFTNLTISGATGTHALTFTSTGLTAIASANFNVAVSGATGDLSGTVTLANLTPVGGGAVEVLSGQTVVQTIPVAGNGTYSFTGIGVGPYNLRLQPVLSHSMGPAEPATRSVTVTANNTTVQNFVVKPALYADDFQSYTTTTLRDGCGRQTGTIPAGSFFSGSNTDMGCSGTNSISMDNTGGPNGASKAMRYDWAARPFVAPASTYCTTETTIGVAPRFNPPPVADTLWIRFTSKESAGFAHGSQTCGSTHGLAYKFFLVVFSKVGVNARVGTYLFPAVTGSATNGEFGMDMNDGLGNTRSLNGPPNANDPTAPFPLGTTWNGQYHTWHIQIFGLGGSTVTYRVYMDGVMLRELVGPFIPNQVVGGNGWAFQFEVGANINNGPEQAQSRHWRELGIYTSRPSMLRLPP